MEYDVCWWLICNERRPGEVWGGWGGVGGGGGRQPGEVVVWIGKEKEWRSAKATKWELSSCKGEPPDDRGSEGQWFNVPEVNHPKQWLVLTGWELFEKTLLIDVTKGEQPVSKWSKHGLKERCDLHQRDQEWTGFTSHPVLINCWKILLSTLWVFAGAKVWMWRLSVSPQGNGWLCWVCLCCCGTVS